MNTELLTPEHVQAALDALGLDIRVQAFDASTATSQEAADAIGAELGSIVKSLCFFIDGAPVIVLGSGDQRMDERKLGALRGVGRKKVKMATAEQSIDFTGYAPGGVPPVGHRAKLLIYIDDMLARYEIVYAAAGSPNAIFPIPFKTLVRVTGGEVVDIARKE
jgi:prolyl-tRNA editing enzyme YbaK/EbsC (Cys-tRNA(Pro) deacylase)